MQPSKPQGPNMESKKKLDRYIEEREKLSPRAEKAADLAFGKQFHKIWKDKQFADLAEWIRAKTRFYLEKMDELVEEYGLLG
jgi:hypothetical protein